MHKKQNNGSSSLEKITNNYTRIPVHDVVRKKMHAYARAAGNNECYGFLLGSPKEAPGLVVEALLAPNQEATGAHAGITGAVAAEAKAEIENRGYYALGFWHSHGNHTTFHSGTDDRNMERLIFSFAGNSNENQYGPSGERGSGYRDGKIIIRMEDRIVEIEQENPSEGYYVRPVDKNECTHPAIYGFNFPDGSIGFRSGEDFIIVQNLKSAIITPLTGVLQKKRGIAYSIVVNNRNEEFSLIGVQQWCVGCENISQEIKRAEVESVQTSREQYDEATLAEEVRARVNASPKNDSLFKRLFQ